MYSSLYDRISNRPFLEDIEKKWLAFQLLCALRDCHTKDIYHGDIKAQNVLVTSWNWLYLTDFSSAFKPVMLPDDNPGDFSYFFDSSGRRTCYIAPERFYAAGAAPPETAKMTWAMDIFSAGCVIAQMFLESEIFSLAQLYKYRRGEYDPVITHLSVISDKDVREMIANMIHLDPEKRYSADQCLDFWKGKVFPHYFYNFLHQYMELVTDPSSGNSPMSGAQKNEGESDDRIDRVYYDFDKISYFLGYQSDKRTQRDEPRLQSKLGLSHFPVQLSIPNNEHTVSADLEPPEDDGTLIFLTLVASAMRTTGRATSRIRACDILLAFAERLTDEAKLDRVLPYLMTLLRRDETDMVVVSVIRTITQLLQMVHMVTPINSHVIGDYILPRMEIALGSKTHVASPIVRATFASCLGSLASSAQRYLDLASSVRPDGSMSIADPEIEPGAAADTNFESIFDNAGRQLFEKIEAFTKQLVEDPDVYVRRAFLSSVPELCMFFKEQSNDVLLAHLNTYLNDRDWTLKCAFFDTVVGIAAFIGSVSLEEFMLPLMLQALADPEEYVVQAAIHSLAQLAGLGLLSKAKLWELLDLIGRFTMHPNIWIRESAAEFISMSASFLGPADVRCFLLPLVKPYLKIAHLPDYNELSVLDALQTPLTRPVFDQAITWATQTDRGLFWKSLQHVRSLAFGSSSTLTARSKDLISSPLSKSNRNDEDDQWLEKLRNLGLKPEDEIKLLALREFIWRLSSMRTRDSSPAEPNVSIGLISLKDLGVTPQSVFFNDTPLKDPSITPDLEPPSAQYTIADALLDASMTIDDSVAKRRKATNMHKNRVQSVGPRGGRILSPSGSGRATSRDSRVPSNGSRDDVSVNEGPYALRRAMRHQTSALSLLDRKDGGKSIPETGTSDTNAFGEMEGPFTQMAPAQRPSSVKNAEAQTTKQPKHSYAGNDPSIQFMLDNMYVDNFPRDVLEFGPMVEPISRRKNRAVRTKTTEERWKPQGHLVATFGEHKGSINRVVVSPDHMFFVTGGDDGAVKVWDTARLERNITHRSRQTHKHADGARVMALCFIENSHCFVSCASDGSVDVVKVDTVSASGVIRYGKLRVLREYRLPEGESAVWCEHFRQETNSVLILATNKSRILGIDLRTMTLLYVLENPVHHGTPTCFCVDRKRHWLCVGTTHGIIDLWDLRFQVRLKAMGVPGKSAIYRICIHPSKGRGKWVLVSGGAEHGEITTWDLEKTTCREIYRTGAVKDGPKGYAAWDVDKEKPEGVLSRFATNLDMADSAHADRGVRAIAAGISTGEDSRDIRHSFIVSGGSDRKMRFWDISRVENSCVFSGLQPEEAQPTYSAVQPTTSTTVSTERFARHGSAAAAAAGTGTGSRPKKTTNGRPARSTVISLQQQQLLQSHLDSIQDVALLEYPYTMSISVDRLGMVFVFH